MNKLWPNPMPLDPETNLEDRITEACLFGASGTPTSAVFTMCKHGYGESAPLIEAVEALGVPLLLDDEGVTTRVHYADDTRYIRMWFGGSELGLAGSFTDRQQRNEILDIAKAHIHPTSRKTGSIFTVVSTPGGLGLQRIGRVQSEFSELNYTPQIVEDYAHITGCLRSSTPCGRFILLAGPPGTGKSFMIRALACGIDATFILIGASLVGQISGPSIMPILMEAQQKSTYDETAKALPTVLILEDADGALVKREMGSIDRISDVLNLGDGLLGEMMDVRIVATTNAERVNLDPAITRPGRMCRHLEFGALGREQAETLFHSLTGKHTSGSRFDTLTLAELYRMAREDGWAPSKKEEFSAGDYR